MSENYETTYQRTLDLYMRKGRYGERLISEADERRIEKLALTFGDFAIEKLEKMKSAKTFRELVALALDPETNAKGAALANSFRDMVLQSLGLDAIPPVVARSKAHPGTSPPNEG